MNLSRPQSAPPVMLPRDNLRSDLRRISALTGPILFAMVMQSAYSLIDIAFIGSIGRSELAAVGLGAYLTSSSLAILVGLATGVQALSAEAIGRGEGRDAVGAVLRAGIVCALVGGTFVGLTIGVIGDPLVSFLTSDTKVASAAHSYFLIRALGMPAMAMNVIFRGYWKGIGRPAFYSATLCFSFLLNILLDWLLIFGNLGFPRLGLAGAAIGFSLSATVATCIYLVTAVALAQLRASPSAPPLPIARIVKRSAPAGVQQLIGVLSFPAILFMLGKLGTVSLAAGTILLNLSFSMIILGQAFGFASATLACEAIGAGQAGRARTVTLRTGILAAFLTAIPGLAMIAAPANVLGLFTNDPTVAAVAMRSLRLVGVAIAVDAFGMVVLQTMLTAGKGGLAIAISLPAQWAVAMPLSFVLGPHFGFEGVWFPQIGLRIFLAIALAAAWFGVRTKQSTSANGMTQPRDHSEAAQVWSPRSVGK